MKTYKISLLHNEGAPITITEEQYESLNKTGILEKSKFIKLGDRTIATHQIAQIYPIEELPSIKAPVVHTSVKEFLCSLRPHEIAEFAEQRKSQLSPQAYRSIIENTFTPSRIEL